MWVVIGGIVTVACVLVIVAYGVQLVLQAIDLPGDEE